MTFILRRHIFNQLLAAIAAFTAPLLNGMWLGWVSVVLPKFETGDIPIKMTAADISWMVSLLDFGNVLSPIPTGYLIDGFGRRFTLRLASFLLSLASALTFFASVPNQLLLARFLAGVGRGIGYTTSFLYVGEIADPKIRGALCGVMIIMNSGGSVIVMTVGPYVSFDTLNCMMFVFPAAGLLLTAFIVESPHYFILHKKPEAAAKAFGIIRDDEGLSASAKAEFNSIQKKVEDDMESKGNRFLSLLSTKGNRRAMAIVLSTGVLARVGGVVTVLPYVSTTLPENSFWDPTTTLMIFPWMGIVFSVIGVNLVDIFGRKPLLALSALGGAVCLGTSAVFYYFQEKSAANVSQLIFVPHIAIVLFAAFYSLGAAYIPHTFQSELFPTRTKGQAAAIMTLLDALGAFVINKYFFLVQDNFGVYLIYLIYASANFATAVFTLFVAIETKGKTLAEIQDILNSHGNTAKPEVLQTAERNTAVSRL